MGERLRVWNKWVREFMQSFSTLHLLALWFCLCVYGSWGSYPQDPETTAAFWRQSPAATFFALCGLTGMFVFQATMLIDNLLEPSSPPPENP